MFLIEHYLRVVFMLPQTYRMSHVYSFSMTTTTERDADLAHSQRSDDSTLIPNIFSVHLV